MVDATQVTFAVVSAVLQVALAVWIYAASPNSWVNRGFAIFLFSQGLGDVAGSLSDLEARLAGSSRDIALTSAAQAAWRIASFAVAVTAFAYPGGRRVTRAGGTTLAVLAAVGVVGILAVMNVRWTEANVADSTAYLIAAGAGLVLYQGQAFWALRVSRFISGGTESEQRSARLVALGMVVYPLWATMPVIIPVPGPLGFVPVSWQFLNIVVGGTALACALFVVIRLARPGPTGRWRGTPIVISVAALVLGAVSVLAASRGITIDAVTYYVSNILLVTIIGYAILRRDVFTLDHKVRFGISKGTVAGVVVAVVFVVSEAAQGLFGDDKQWLGLAVGGLVVFAIAPLQRAADRFAEKAVPKASAADSNADAEDSFRDALHWALRDGRLDASEERRLVLLAERLGIKASRAFELRDEARHAPTGQRKRLTSR